MTIIITKYVPIALQCQFCKSLATKILQDIHSRKASKSHRRLEDVDSSTRVALSPIVHKQQPEAKRLQLENSESKELTKATKRIKIT